MKAAVVKGLRRVHWKGTRTVGAAQLYAGVLSGRVTELWIGDSHSVLLNTDRFPLYMDHVGDQRFVWHLGPRIMHSIATQGFPEVVLNRARRLGRLRRARDLTCFFIFGEIDVRCHLGPRMAQAPDSGWITAYVERCASLGKSFGADRVVIVAPPPPSDAIADHAMFPIAGDIAARTAAHAWLCDALLDAAPADDTWLSVLDLRPALADADGHLPDSFTYDGCHTNDAGRVAVRTAVSSHLSHHPIPSAQEGSR